MPRFAPLAPFALALALPPAAVIAQAEGFRLALPIDCPPEESCVVQNYVDADPGPGTQDYSCGPLSYDGHKGTDFRLSNIARQREGVDVLAAAPGVVLGMRDEMPDILQGWEGAPELNGRDCGNGVVIGHEGGWETQYCHMARGSIAVRSGDRVETGDVLGQVGLSGRTQFPHLHLSVRRDGAEIDPFDPEDEVRCGAASETLWQETPDYVPGGLLDAGFAPAVPDWLEIQKGTVPGGVGPDTPMVLWGSVFGARAGDVMRLVVEGPEGPVFDQEVPLDRTQAQLFRATGLRAPAAGWTEGRYEGHVSLIREGEPLSERAVSLDLGR